MSNSLSPDQFGASPPQESPESAVPGSDRGALSSLNLNFFKSLSDKKTTRNGNPPKRRGPKPDSKPALTRRQELNRQAQRTHRERKELYIKALEEEVLRLKEIFSTVSQDKKKLIDENKVLKEILTQSGISFPKSGGGYDDPGNDGAGHFSNTSVSGNSFAQGSHGSFSPQATHSTSASLSPPNMPSNHYTMSASQTQREIEKPKTPTRAEVDQAGIDFVLMLEKPCMAHIPFLVDRANGSEVDSCGHALMASCPPAPFPDLKPDTPFGNTHTHDTPGEQPAQGTWELSKSDLATLLDLSTKLDLDGEITPVMAWGHVLSHPRFAELVHGDYRKLGEELLRKVRCYGFGAVMEEFELRDALENVLSSRMETMVF